MFSLLAEALRKIKRYFKDNVGTPFVIAFQLLVLASVGLLIQGSITTANQAAIYAYYLLVVAVVLMLISPRSRQAESEKR